MTRRSNSTLKVITKKAGHALHVLDRFHVVARLNKAIHGAPHDEIPRLKRGGYDPG